MGKVIHLNNKVKQSKFCFEKVISFSSLHVHINDIRILETVGLARGDSVLIEVIDSVWDRVSSPAKKIKEVAENNGCDFILFETDGPEIPGFEIFNF